MKIFFVITAIIFVTTMSVFAQKKTTSKKTISQNKVSGESFTDKEAKAEAQKYFDSVVSKCDGSTYLLYHYQETLIELKGESIKVEPAKLTAADKLNEVEWIGVVKLTPQFIRPYYYPNRQWEDWVKDFRVGSDFIIIDGEVEIRLKKKKGMPWETTYSETTYEKVACEELPWRNVETLARKDTEAKETAEEFYRNILTKCGDFYYVSYQLSSPVIIRLKEFSVQVFPTIPTKYKESQGIEWLGIAYLNRNPNSSEQCDAPQCKNWSTSNILSELRWTNLRKVKGEWKSDGLSLSFLKKIDCKEVNKYTANAN